MIRFKILLVLFFSFAFVLISRLFFWQVFSHEKFQIEAKKEHFYAYDVKPLRGKIISSDGIEIASNQLTYTIYATYPQIKDKESLVRSLSPLFLKVDLEEELDQNLISDEEKKDRLKKIEGELEEKLSLKDLVWVPLRKKVSSSISEEIKNLNLEGVGLEKDYKRFYPESSSSAQLLGFVGSDERGKDKGYFGLEGFYDGLLKGREGRLKVEVDIKGNPILVGERIEISEVDGQDLLTNIDSTAQYIVEKYLKEGVKRYGAKGGSVIILDPKTGAVLANANIPSYDGAKWSKFPKEVYKNPVVADVYEPGSTFKLITFAAALNENVIKPDTRCPCEGPKEVGGFEIKTWNNKYNPNSTAVEVLQHSDNVGAAYFAEKLGLDKFLKYIKNFGFGTLTGVDLEEEATGIIKPKKEWKDIDLNTAAFGQGLSVTPLQMVRAVGAIANGGKLMQPYVVKKIIGDKKTVEIKPKLIKQILKEDIAQLLSEMMVQAVEGGEAKKLVPKGYRIAGKTGTAQIPIEGHYDPNKTVASFVGFGPVEDPKFVMLVKFDQPSTSPYGSETAAPLFFEITTELFSYWGIAPSK